MSTQRDTCERELGKALSRHIGYTTGAFDLDRLVQIASYCAGRAAVFGVELINLLIERYKVTKHYASGILDFAVALGLLARVDRTGRLGKFTLTNIGRTVTAAETLGLNGFRDFLLNYCILEADSDIYMLTLEAVGKGGAKRKRRLFDEFQSRTNELRHLRLDWLHEVLQHPQLVRRVAVHIEWLHVPDSYLGRSLSIETAGDDFARHHVSPRTGWGTRLGHLDEDGMLTSVGSRLLDTIRDGTDQYFWIGPTQGCCNALRLPPESLPSPLGPTWDLLRPRGAAVAPPRSLITEVVAFMLEAYPTIRLAHSNQADLEAVVPFVYYCEREHGLRVERNRLFTTIFTEYREVFAPLSKRSIVLGHYQVRRR